MTEPKWLTDATTIADLLNLPEAEQERWEVSSGEDQGWVGWHYWRRWSDKRVVRARRRKQTVTIDADVLRVIDAAYHGTSISDSAELHAAQAELRLALAALDGDA